jgi:hypothetical protein
MLVLQRLTEIPMNAYAYQFVYESSLFLMLKVPELPFVHNHSWFAMGKGQACVLEYFQRMAQYKVHVQLIARV